MLFLHRPPDAGEREDGAGFVIGPVIDLNAVTHEGVKVEQTNGDVGAICLVACLLGEAAREDVKPSVTRAQTADERSNRGSSSMRVLGRRAGRSRASSRRAYR